MTDAAATPTSRRVLLALTGIAVGMAIAGALLFFHYARRMAPDPALVAVAPFDVMVEGRGLAGARVGLASALTRAIDGSGSYRAIPQSEVARVWRARPTPLIAAIELARKTGAGLAIYGRLDPGPGDSVRVRAAVLDAPGASGRFEVETVQPVTGLDRAADSLAAFILRRLAAR